MFSRPIYYFSQGEHKVNELRDNLKPEIEHLHFQTWGHEGMLNKALKFRSQWLPV